MSKLLGRRYRRHGNVCAIRNVGAGTVRHAEVSFRDDIRWVVEVIRNP